MPSPRPHCWRHTFGNGVIFVDLSALSDPALVVPSIAHAMGLADTLPGALEAALRDQHLLLVLDNFEQVLDAARDIDELLQSSPALHVLITSRARLHLRDEHVLLVPPLADGDAVDLFVRRAQATRPDFELTPTNAGAVAEICARLDGIPLALELAAARTRVLSAQQIAQRLGERFDLLTSGAANGPARHRTLRAALDWSFLMLGQPERALLCRMAVFAGGSNLTALESVAVSDDLDRFDLLDALTQLVEHSLVGVQEEAGEARYRLLETIREYGLERLRESGEDEDVRERTAAWCLELAERAEPELKGSHARTWLDALDRELDNMRGAISWWLERRATEPVLRLAGALWAFCEIRGHMREGRAWLTAALELDRQSGVDPRVRSKALHGACILAAVSGDYDGAIALQEANLSLNRGLGNTRGVAMSLLNLTNLMRCQGEAERAIAFGNESLALFRELGEQRSVCDNAQQRGHGAHHPTRLRCRAGGARGGAGHIPRVGLPAPDRVGARQSRRPGAPGRQLRARRSPSDRERGDLPCARQSVGQRRLARGTGAGRRRPGPDRARGPTVRCRGSSARSGRRRARAVRSARARSSRRDAACAPRPRRAGSTLGVRALAVTRTGPWSSRATRRHRQKQHREPTRIAVAQTVALEGSPLTDREREVAALVAHGLTNRQIADALVITKQTADKHVGNILGKLGVASRAQVAVWVVQHGVRPLAPASAA